MPQNGNFVTWSLPAGQTSGRRSVSPSMAGSLGSPRSAERTRRPAEDGEVAKKTTLKDQRVVIFPGKVQW